MIRTDFDCLRLYARLLLIQKTGHLAHLEQPEIFFGAVEQFLAGDWPVGSEDR